MDYKRYNVHRLIEDSDIVAIADAMGVQSKGSGGNMQFICPNPNHPDKHFGSCKLTRDGRSIICYCCTGRNGGPKIWDPLTLLTECFGFKFRDACDYLADRTGNPDSYLDKEAKADRTKKEDRLSRTLTRDEKELLGLCNGSRVRIPVRPLQTGKERLPTGYVADRHEYIRYGAYEEEWCAYKNAVFNPLLDMEDSFRCIVLGKCREKISYLNGMFSEYCFPTYGKYSYIQFVRKAFRENGIADDVLPSAIVLGMQALLKTYYRFGGKAQTIEDICCEHMTDVSYV